MSVYIDLHAPAYDGSFRLVADSDEELDSFAIEIGLRPAWARRSRAGLRYYDLLPAKRDVALVLGAVPLPLRDLFRLGDAARYEGPQE